jgi:hypothetical protein
MASLMDQLRWSDAEKKIARRVFEKALQRELDEVGLVWRTCSVVLITNQGE